MKILVTGAWKHTDEQLNAVRALKHEIVEMSEDSSEPPCDDFDAIICNDFFLYHNIEDYKNLKYIQLTSAGLDRVPLGYIRDHNIEIRSARGVYSIPMAEHAVLKVLEIYKDSRGFSKKQTTHKWIKNRGLRELFGKNVCVVGCGSVGTECAKRFKAFGCTVIGVDNYVKEWFDGIVSLESGFETADVVILTLPLTEETKGIIDEDLIKKLRPGSVVVNISRGAIITRDALLCRDDVFFALDVFEKEPLPEADELWDKENITITPHNSFVGEGNSDRMFELVCENLKALC